MTKSKIMFTDVAQIDKDKRVIELVINRLTNLLPKLEKNGIKVKSMDKLFSFIDDPSKLYNAVIAVSESDAKNHTLASIRKSVLDAGLETAKELKRELLGCFNGTITAKTTEDFVLANQFHFDPEAFRVIRPYLELKDSKLLLKPGFEAPIKELRTYSPNEIGTQLFLKLEALISAATSVQEFCDKNGLMIELKFRVALLKA